MGLEDKIYDFNQEYNESPVSMKQVDELLEEMYSSIMEEIEEKYGKNKNIKNYFRFKTTRTQHKQVIIAELHKELIKTDCVENVTYKAFYEVFSGSLAKEPYSTIKWLKTNTLLVYLIDELIENEWLEDYHKNKKTELFFLDRHNNKIKGVSSVRGNLSINSKSDYKPKNHEIIDEVIDIIQNILNT